MRIELSVAQKQELETHHRYEGAGHVRDRIKAVLLCSEGWTSRQIGQALRIHEATVERHIQEWLKESKLKPANGGSISRLTVEEAQELANHITSKLYTKVMDICAYVELIYRKHYTISGMTKWLKQQGFSYKKPKAVPAKADAGKQSAFIDYYRALIAQMSKAEAIVFMDSAHPTMATKISHGWIKKGQDKAIAQTASRTRLNVMGAIELATMSVISSHPEHVNAESTVAFLQKLRAQYESASLLHVVLDQSGYHKSHKVKEFAESAGIVLHYLPPYSPNLNPIERLWKFMNEQVRNNRFFASAKEFRQVIGDFFENKVNKISAALRERINDNFEIVTAPSG